MARSDAERELLFAHLAVRNLFLPRHRLLGTLNTWMSDPAWPPERQLRERGGLSAHEHGLLRDLVVAIAARYDGDLKSALVALRAAGLTPNTPTAPNAPGVGIPDSGREPESASAAFTLPSSPTPAETIPTETIPTKPPRDAASENAPADRETPATAPTPTRYEIRQTLGRDQGREVQLAYDRERQVLVVMETIADEDWRAVADDREAADHLWHAIHEEAHLLSRIEHPAIPKLIQMPEPVLEGAGAGAMTKPHYVRSYHPGMTLSYWIGQFHEADLPSRDTHQRTLDLGLLLMRLLPICEAVAAAHEQGIIHGGIAPERIMVDAYGRSVLIGWSQARKAPPENTDHPVPETGLPHVTPYTPPEWLTASVPAPGTATLGDVYSLGAVVYTLLTGQTPFPPDDGLKPLVREAILGGDFPLPRTVQRRTPPVLESICLKAMAKLPQNRYPTARALADDLTRHLAGVPCSVQRPRVTPVVQRWDGT